MKKCYRSWIAVIMSHYDLYQPHFAKHLFSSYVISFRIDPKWLRRPCFVNLTIRASNSLFLILSFFVAPILYSLHTSLSFYSCLFSPPFSLLLSLSVVLLPYFLCPTRSTGQPACFCHLMTRTCWGHSHGVQHLEDVLIERKKSAPQVQQYTLIEGRK